MKKFFAAVTAAVTLGALPVAAQEGAQPPVRDIRADVAALTDTHCALVGTGPRDWICTMPDERQRLGHIYQFTLSAAVRGEAYTSVWMYRAGMSEAGALPDGADVGLLHGPLAQIAAEGLCARHSTTTTRTCTPQQMAALRDIMRAAYAGDSIEIPAHKNSPGAADTREVLRSLEENLNAAIESVLAPAARAFRPG